jgi:outer membrane protein assembly factor BamB
MYRAYSTKLLHAIGTLLFTSAITVYTHAQPGIVSTFGGPAAQDGIGAVAQTDGFLIAARAFDPTSAAHVVQLYKRTLSGQALSTITLPIEGAVFPQALAPAADEGALLAGSVIRPGESTHDGLLIRLDAAGTVLWTLILERPGDQIYLGVSATPDGGAIVCGVNEQGAGHDALLARFDANGSLLWEQVFEELFDAELHAVVPDPGNGILATGRTLNAGGTSDVLLVRTDDNGETVWVTTDGGPADDTGRSVRSLGNGQCVIAGTTLSYGPANAQGQRKASVYLAAFDLQGDTLWTSTYGDTLVQRRAHALDVAPNGDLLVAGELGTTGSTDALVLRFNATGEWIWTRTFDLGEQDQLVSLQALANGFVAAGGSFESMGRQILLVRRDANGN